jgi:TetR/AcrR family transcriptional repressor of mexJK operon
MNRRPADVRRNGEPQTKKELEVLNVASEYFLSHGYRGASINAMARESGISKESIYRYFSSKKALFESVIAKELREYRERLDFFDVEYESMPLPAVLRQIGESIMQAVTSDRVLALRRLVFQEAAKSPEIGQLYYEIGPQAAYVHLEKFFTMHAAETDIDPATLSYSFVALLLHKLMLQRECAVIGAPTREEISEHVATVTDEFLRLYFAPREKRGA